MDICLTQLPDGTYIVDQSYTDCDLYAYAFDAEAVSIMLAQTWAHAVVYGLVLTFISTYLIGHLITLIRRSLR